MLTLMLWPCLTVLFSLGMLPLHYPLHLDRCWLVLLLPLIIVISVVYKTIKIPDLSKLPQQAAVLTLQIILFMALVAAALWLISELA